MSKKIQVLQVRNSEEYYCYMTYDIINTYITVTYILTNISTFQEFMQACDKHNKPILSNCLCKNNAKSEKCDTPQKRLRIFIFVIKLFYGSIL